MWYCVKPNKKLIFLLKLLRTNFDMFTLNNIGGLTILFHLHLWLIWREERDISDMVCDVIINTERYIQTLYSSSSLVYQIAGSQDEDEQYEVFGKKKLKII